MPELTLTIPDATDVPAAFACYLQAAAANTGISSRLLLDIDHSSQQYGYELPLGTLRILKISLHLPALSTVVEIESARKSAIKSALAWLKSCLLLDKRDNAEYHYVLTLDMQLLETTGAPPQWQKAAQKKSANFARSIKHSLGARYFMEELVIDVTASAPVLQIFSEQDWNVVLATLQTPYELWQFLSDHLAQLQQSAESGIPSFENEQQLLAQFMSSEYLFTQALAVDNVLIKQALQETPNSALVTMSLAQRHQNATAQMYHQHMQQASILWAQLSVQMLAVHTKNAIVVDADKQKAVAQSLQWQQQLLDESLFSRHELVRTLYQHAKQTPAMIESGYVVHQHSYTSLGRHYVLIFYGQAPDSKHSKAAIQPNLQQIAHDVATRLPLAELHHVVVLGIEFVLDNEETFIDIDVWMQPITAMTQKERQLTKQLQRLHQPPEQPKNRHVANKNKRPSLQLNLSIPARYKKPNS